MKFMYIDTHCHLSLEEDIQSVMNRCYEAKVNQIIISGCDFESIPESIEIAQDMKDIYLALGFHPETASKVTKKDLEILENEIKSNPKIVAVGEIGLDFHYGREDEKEQVELFRTQLSMAAKYHLPVVIHTRDAIELTYQILKEYDVKGVIHCYSGSLEMAKKLIDLGYCLGIGGVLTFKNCKLKETLKQISISNLVLETDSPYLTPVPYRGQPNHPYYVPYVAQALAEIYQLPIEEVARITSATAKRIFDRMK